MRKIAAVTVLLVVLGSFGFGQNYLGFFNYQSSFPQENTKDLIDKTSWLGFGVDARKFLTPSFSLGVSLQRNIFREEHQNESAIAYNKELNAYPLLLTAHIYLRKNETLIPYLGIGAGAYRIHFRRDTSLNVIKDGNWHFGYAPELGVVAKLSNYLGILFSVKYNYAYKSREADARSYWTFVFGFGWVQN